MTIGAAAVRDRNEYLHDIGAAADIVVAFYNIGAAAVIDGIQWAHGIGPVTITFT
jgi:hypothetical protein